MKLWHPIRLDQPVHYRLTLQGQVEVDWSDWFSGEVDCILKSIEDGAKITILTGKVVDQAALHGALRFIRDLGVPLLAVDCLSAYAETPQLKHFEDPQGLEES